MMMLLLRARPFLGASLRASLSTAANQAVTTSDEGGMFRITMNRPTRYNAWNNEVFQGMRDALHKGVASKAKIAVLTGAGSFFTSGNDMSNFVTTEPMNVMAKRFAQDLQVLIGEVIDFPKPIIAAVNGPAIGIGTTILGLCDFVFASDKAYFLTPFTSVGLCPEACSSYTIPALVGPLRANELLLANQRWNAQQAVQYGLVNAVYSDAEFSANVEKRIQEFLQLPAQSLQFGKSIIRATVKETLHRVNAIECAGIEKQIQSDDCRAAFESFNKRKKN